MNRVLTKVQQSFNAAFEVDPSTITLDTQPGDLEVWDSMGHVTLASCLEREFDITFDVDDLMAMESVRDIVRIVEGKLSHRSGK